MRQRFFLSLLLLSSCRGVVRVRVRVCLSVCKCSAVDSRMPNSDDMLPRALQRANRSGRVSSWVKTWFLGPPGSWSPVCPSTIWLRDKRVR